MKYPAFYLGNVLCGELSDDLTLQNGTKSVTPWAGYLTTNPPSNPYFPGTLISPSLFLLSKVNLK